MFSVQDSSGSIRQQTHNDSLNSKHFKTVQKYSNTTSESKQVDNHNKKAGNEFKVYLASQEYTVLQHNDVFIVRPSDIEDADMPLMYKKSSVTLVDLRKSEKNILDRPTKSARPKSQRTPDNASRKEPWNYKKVLTMKEVKPKVSWKGNCTLVKRSRDFFNSVNQAIKLQKIFAIGNCNRRAFPPIREALKTRGWVEKCSATQSSLEEEVIDSKTSELVLRLLKDTPAYFIWVMSFIDFGNIKDNTIVSRYPKNNHFTTKVGLCSFLEEFHWFYEPNISKTVTPRTFRIATGSDIDNFIKDFGLTACVSLLKIVVKEISTAESDRFFKNGKVPIAAVDFANAQCSEYILCRHHDDIDRTEDNPTTAKEWSDFLNWFYLIAHKKESFETSSFPMIQALYTMSKMTLKNIEPYWPQLEMEGCRNLWVVKPAAQFCGRGVRVMQHLEDIVNHVEIASDSKISQHVVQKYIERPLLIYDTKFDIRQWFLVTSVYPLVIWMYKECYLRFSSQPFSLEDLHESIHLTNNAIQKNYINNSARNSKLPKENMWHSSTFQEHLNDIGEPEKWKNVILPGMKEGIVGAVLASQEEMVDRQNSFELYGADFLLTEDYTPLLLEINMGPSMAPSTEITANLCKKGLEDIIKVVLDRRQNPRADTGQFEILYKQEIGPRQHHVGIDLTICGSKITPEVRMKKVKKTI